MIGFKIIHRTGAAATTPAIAAARGPIALNPSSNFSPYPRLFPAILSIAPTSMKIIIINTIALLIEIPDIHSPKLSVNTPTFVMLETNS